MYKILVLLFISCSCLAQTGLHPERLKKAFIDKNERFFLAHFPEKFDDFKSTFGWNDASDQPNPLYHEANACIDYFFQLASSGKYPESKAKAINIAIGGLWEADGVGYFQRKLQTLTETDQDFVSLLNKLDQKTAASFWRFYFDQENLSYPPELMNILDEPMKSQSLSVFKSIGAARRKENTADHKTFDYIVFDQDGDANLRTKRSASAKVIEKVKTEESIVVLDKASDWWYVQTKSGKIGFIHKSRIRIK